MLLLKKKIKVKNEDILPIISIIFAISYYTLSNSLIFTSIFKILLVVSLLSFLLYFIQLLISNRMKMSKKLWFYLLILAICTCISAVHYGDTRIIFILISIIIGFFINIETILSTVFFTKLFWIIITMLTGGYTHINSLALNIGILMLLYICCMKERINNCNILVFIMLYLFFCIYTNSGAFLIGIGIAISMLVATKKTKSFKKILLAKPVVYIYPIILFINWYLAYGFYHTEMPFIGSFLPDIVNKFYFEFLYMLNKMLTGRISLANLSLKYFGVSIWGGNIKYSGYELGGNYFNLDSGMIWLLQGFGIIITIIIMFLFVYMMRILVKRKEYSYLIAGVVIALWAMNEDMLMSISTNFMFFLIGMTLRYSKKKEFIHEYT